MCLNNVQCARQSGWACNLMGYRVENVFSDILFMALMCMTPMLMWVHCVCTYICMGWEESGFSFWGLELVLFLFYVNVSGMLLQSHLSSQPLTIPAPWVFLYIGSSIPLVPPWVIASHFLVRNGDTELKPTAFSSLLLFGSFFYSTFDCCLLGLLLNSNIYIYIVLGLQHSTKLTKFV